MPRRALTPDEACFALIVHRAACLRRNEGRALGIAEVPSILSLCRNEGSSMRLAIQPHPRAANYRQSILWLLTDLGFEIGSDASGPAVKPLADSEVARVNWAMGNDHGVTFSELWEAVRARIHKSRAADQLVS